MRYIPACQANAGAVKRTARPSRLHNSRFVHPCGVDHPIIKAHSIMCNHKTGYLVVLPQFSLTFVEIKPVV